MTTKEIIALTIRPGIGSLKYFRYWVPGLRMFKTKKQIKQAISLNMVIYKQCKTERITYELNYKTGRFERMPGNKLIPILLTF